MNVDEERGEIEHVILSEAKDLRRERIVCQRLRSFASLRMTWGAIPRYFLNIHDRVPTKYRGMLNLDKISIDICS